MADLIDIQASSVLVCMENGWDVTAQVRGGWAEKVAYSGRIVEESNVRVYTAVMGFKLEVWLGKELR